MALLGGLYDRVLSWSARPDAKYYLGGLSFAESSFFPIPPDVLLAPMTLAKPESAWRLAALTTVASVLGGVFGYLLGLLAFDQLSPWIDKLGYTQAYETARGWFDRWGFWAIFAAGFTPVPYKIFTIAAGAFAMAWPPFLLGSLVGRGGRFFLVAALVRFGGPKVEHHLRRHIDLIGGLMLVLLVIAYLLLRH